MKNIWRTHFPYCLQEIKKNEWVFLNRFYKPIGTINNHADNWFEYDQYTVSMKLTKKDIGFLSDDFKDERYFFFKGTKIAVILLYDECSNPDCGKKHKELYLKKLELLMMKQIKQDD